LDAQSELYSLSSAVYGFAGFTAFLGLSVGPFTLHSKSQREDELQNNIAEESQDLENHEKQNNRG
jgi:hypothetical protein